MDFSVTIDSAAVDHVTTGTAAPGYKVDESAASRLGGGVVAADGNQSPNEGQMTLALEKEATKFKSIFQIAEITQTLMRLKRIFEMCHKVLFITTEATVDDAKTGEGWDRTIGVLGCL